MTENENLQSLYVDQLRDLYSAEHQILEALPKMVKRSAHRELRVALDHHYRVTEEQVSRLNAELEERVQERTEERDRVWNNSRDIFVVLDDNVCLRAASPAWTEVLGHPTETVEGRALPDFVADEDREAMRAALKRAADGEDLTSFETRMITAAGEK